MLAAAALIAAVGCSVSAGRWQGRRWEDVSATFEDIWVMALRAMDDIKESVRQAAAKLIRTLRGLTLRLCDPAHTPKVPNLPHAPQTCLPSEKNT